MCTLANFLLVENNPLKDTCSVPGTKQLGLYKIQTWENNASCLIKQITNHSWGKEGSNCLSSQTVVSALRVSDKTLWLLSHPSGDPDVIGLSADCTLDFLNHPRWFKCVGKSKNHCPQNCLERQLPREGRNFLKKMISIVLIPFPLGA